MRKTKIMKITALAACMSLLFAIPVFADNGQNTPSNMNNFPFQNGTQFQNNMQFQNGTQGAQQNQRQNNGSLSNAAQYMVNKGIIKGDTSGNYSMTSNVKRCDMSIMLVRAFNLNTGSAGGSNFGDIDQGSYYYDAVNAIRQLGIAKGDGQNFNPETNMTLEEAILFVERALDSADIDYDEDDLEDIFDGRSLSDYATREDVAAILYAVLGEDYADYFEANAAAVADAITYTTDEDTSLNFDDDDFVDACDDATDGTLDYVKFSNPSTSLGKLYYDYTSSSKYDSVVGSGDKYYYDDDDGDAISEITFVPKANQSGTVKISYTGYDTDGDSFNGTVVITIDADDDTVADTITLETDEDTAIDFDEDDFNDACEDATGETLSYVKFTLPSSTYGKLYYGYDDEDDYDGKVSASSKYYYDPDDDDDYSISDVTFVPKDDYTGTVKISYTGLNEDGETFTGTVKITVE